MTRMMIKSSVFAAFFVFLIGGNALGVPIPKSQSFESGNFDNGIELFFDGAGAAQSAGLLVSGGVSGFYLKAVERFSGVGVSVIFFHGVLITHEPNLDGAVAALDMEFSARIDDVFFDLGEEHAQTIFVAPAVQVDGGDYYVAIGELSGHSLEWTPDPSPPTPPIAWGVVSFNGLESTDFIRVDTQGSHPGEHPDFSANTGRLDFGIAFDADSESTQITNVHWGIDELTMTIFAGVDADGDGVDNVEDNCLIAANPGQDDTDGDDCGNLCDADYNDNGIVDFLDFSAFSGAFGTNDEEKCHVEPIPGCTVGFPDFGFFSSHFGTTPGPSGTTTGTTACP